MYHDSPRIQQKGRQIQIQGKVGCFEKQPCKSQTKTGRKKIEIKEGDVFGRLTAIRYFGHDNHHHQVWLFSCSCGKEKTISAISVFKGVTKSCGCLRSEVTAQRKSSHGKRRSDEYSIWVGIKQRCFNPNCKEFKWYGLKGIIMCQEWVDDFQSFYEHVGPRPSKKHSIDRIDSSKNYEPGNVRWATSIEQANNKRNNSILTIFGKSKTIAEWERYIGCSKELIRQRIKKLGWSAEKAILTPKRHVDSWGRYLSKCERT